MQHIKYTYIDAKTNIPATQAPMRHGPKVPDVAGLQFGFAEESKYPTEAPTFYGQCPEDADTSKPGVLQTLTDDEYNSALATELDARKQIARRNVDAIRDEKIAVGAPYMFPGGVPGTVQTRDLTDHRNIQANASAAQMYLLNSQPTAEMQFRDMENVVHTLTATEMVQMCSYVMGYGQAIYSASWAHKEAIDALGTIEAVSAYDVTTGWPV